MRRSSVAILLLAVSGLTACSGDDSDDGVDAARAVAQQLAGALATAADPASDAGGDSDDEGGPAPDPFATVPFVDDEGGDGGEGDEPTVAEEYAEVVAGMDGIAPSVEVEDVELTDADADSDPESNRSDADADSDPESDRSDATATLAWSWPVVADADPWRYTTEVALMRSGERWAVRWDRQLVEPTLEGTDVLDAVTQPTDRGDIVGARGEVLVTERPVVRVGIDRTKVGAGAAPSSARALARLVGIDVAPYVAAVRNAGPRAFVEAITYRRDEVPAEVRSGTSAIPGGLQVADELALAPSRDFAAALLGRVGPVTAEMVEDAPDAHRPGDLAGLSGLQARYDEQLRGSVGRTVYAVSEADDVPRRPVYEAEATAGEPLELTLDRGLQALAEKVLSASGPASALVAVRPSDGAILAAANDAGTGGQNLATFGRFAPGSTFKVVTSLALLRAGLDPASTVECTPTVRVDGKQFKNYSDYPSSSLGRIPLGEAIAQSCNTALIDQRGELDEGDLAAAAASLGLGIDHDLGFPAYFGQVPDPSTETELAAGMIGQGKVLASPMAMAAVMASVQEGRTVVPRLVEQVDVEVPDEAQPLTPDEARQLRAMLRRVVTEGSGRGLADVPGGEVIAKTGTAEYADGAALRTHAWMVAARGDLAVAVFVQTGESGSSTAGPLLEDFLRGVG